MSEAKKVARVTDGQSKLDGRALAALLKEEKKVTLNLQVRESVNEKVGDYISYIESMAEGKRPDTGLVIEHVIEAGLATDSGFAAYNRSRKSGNVFKAVKGNSAGKKVGGEEPDPSLEI